MQGASPPTWTAHQDAPPQKRAWILVTGFGPFSSSPDKNPSWECVRQLPDILTVVPAKAGVDPIPSPPSSPVEEQDLEQQTQPDEDSDLYQVEVHKRCLPVDYRFVRSFYRRWKTEHVRMPVFQASRGHKSDSSQDWMMHQMTAGKKSKPSSVSVNGSSILPTTFDILDYDYEVQVEDQHVTAGTTETQQPGSLATTNSADLDALFSGLPRNPPLACVHVGVAAGTHAVHLERFAFNSAFGADIRGYEPLHHRVLEADTLERRRSTHLGSVLKGGMRIEHDICIWVDLMDMQAKMVEQLQQLEDEFPGELASPKRIQISQDAGRYLCNFTYYLSLRFAQYLGDSRREGGDDKTTRMSPTHALFLHVPPADQPFSIQQLSVIVRASLQYLAGQAFLPVRKSPSMKRLYCFGAITLLFMGLVVSFIWVQYMSN